MTMNPLRKVATILKNTTYTLKPPLMPWTWFLKSSERWMRVVGGVSKSRGKVRGKGAKINFLLHAAITVNVMGGGNVVCPPLLSTEIRMRSYQGVDDEEYTNAREKIFATFFCGRIRCSHRKLILR